MKVRNPKVIITGVTGMDGSLMSDYLADRGFDVYGMARPSASPNLENLSESINKSNFQLVSGDLSDEVSINELVKTIKPDFFINFAAHSFVGDSWKQPMKVFDVNAAGVLRCLEAIKNYAPKCKFYNAGTSEEFGDVQYSPQDEAHPIRPRSPYGASKAAARHIVKVYRESYGLFAIQSWCFNHEGERRGEQFVTRKITKWAAQASKSLERGEEIQPITLGNLDARRDWSHAKDMVRAIASMIVNDEPVEYVVSSGKTNSVRHMLEVSMKCAGIDFVDSNPDRIEPCEGGGSQINYIDPDGKPLVLVSKEFYRPAEVELLMGDASKIKSELGWKPEFSFEDLVEGMVKNDRRLLG